ncbi:MAG TPA: hypothetical protein VMT70_11680 [Vicinamibacteria bacterium]|nr:hypothetical protein [Vicinamibacteria bacterium]
MDDATTLSALGWANGSIYRRYGAYNGVQFGLGLSGRHSFTRRFAGRASLSYADGLNLEALYSGRVGLPQIDVKTGVATAGITFTASPSTSLNAGVDATGIRYHTDVLVSTAQLPADSLTPPEVLGNLRRDPTDLAPAPDASLEALGTLATQALSVSSLDFWTWHVSGGLAHTFSPRTSVNLTLGYRETGQEPRTYAVGDQIELSAGLRQALDSGANLNLTYAYQDNRFNPQVQTHSFGGGADKEFNSKVKGDVSFGASYIDSPVPSVSGWTYVGGAGVAVRLKRTFFAARYSRSRYQALVLGRNQVVDLAYGSLGRTVSRRVYLAAFAYYLNARDPAFDLYSYETSVAGVSVSTRIKKRGSAGFSYNFRHYQPTGLIASDRSSISVFASYSRAYK